MRWGIAIDTERCLACQACAVACATENNLRPGTPRDAAEDRLIRWLQFLPEMEGEYPHVKASVTPMMCQHCEDPPCTFVCPVSATYLSGDGTVAQIYWRCIGCRFCVNACPYTMKWFNWSAPQWPAGTSRATNPDVELREVGVTEKCSLCNSRLQRAKEQARAEGRAMRPGEYLPACAEACPTEAIVFGNLDDPESDVARLTRSHRSFRYLEELGSRPKVTYLKPRGGTD